MPDEERQVLTERTIRSELGAILDELGRLPADVFADRSRIQARQADLRRLLPEIEIPGAVDITKRWSAAASKVGSEEPTETIVSPSDMGGGGGI